MISKSGIGIYFYAFFHSCYAPRENGGVQSNTHSVKKIQPFFLVSTTIYLGGLRFLLNRLWLTATTHLGFHLTFHSFFPFHLGINKGARAQCSPPTKTKICHRVSLFFLSHLHSPFHVVLEGALTFPFLTHFQRKKSAATADPATTHKPRTTI